MHTISDRRRARGGMPDGLRAYLPAHLIEPLRTVGGVWEELQLHAGRACSVTVGGENRLVALTVSSDELSDIVMRLCDGSMYAFRDSIAKGYIAPGGGLRVGICGQAALPEGGERLLGLRAVDTLCFRFPHPHPTVGGGILPTLRGLFPHGALIYSPPGVGKTTLLRSLAVRLASGEQPLRVAVVDSRCELDDGCFDKALCLAHLAGYPKGVGIEIAVRTLSAQVIVCDEIGNEGEAQALLAAANCGVPVIASAHADSVGDVLSRPMLATLHRAGIFGAYIGLRRDGARDYRYDVTPHAQAKETVCC